MTTARIICDFPHINPDLFYATRFNTSDPLLYIEIGKKTYFLARETEVPEIRKYAKNVHPYGKYLATARTFSKHPGDADYCMAFLKSKGVRKVILHPKTPFQFSNALSRHGIRLEEGPFPFFPSRVFKSPAELRQMREGQRITFQGTRLVERILRKSTIKGNKIIYQGKALTSEWLASQVKTLFLQHGYTCHNDLIISCGVDSTEPHNRGHGFLRPHQSIIVDLFPRSDSTGFYGDATRTFCKGRAPDALKQLYLTVKTAQELALSLVKNNANGQDIHRRVREVFTKAGFETGIQKGRDVGFFHGTGHGLGLDLHEEPVRINALPFTLKTGHVVTVEPGLYYPGIGGVRIEDVVVVTKTGCQLLARYPKTLEV